MNDRQRDDEVALDGEVLEALPNAMFRVRVEGGHVALAYLSGRIRKNRIKVIPGDHVRVSLSAYDLNRGRITYRHKNPPAPVT